MVRVAIGRVARLLANCRRDGGWCQPPLGSDQAVPILCPLAEALGARLGEHPVVLGGAAIGVGDDVAVGCFGTLLESVAPLAVALGEVQQQRGTVPADHLGALDEQGGEALGVTDESLKTGGGDEGKHRSRGRGVEEVSLSLESILQHRVPLWGVWSENRDSCPTGTRFRVGSGAVLDWR